jgi:O-antigen/teichoic acid export membrane protein
VARLLGTRVFGEFGIVRSTVGMFGVFAGFGLSLTATKYVAEFRQSDPARAGRIIGLSGLFALASGGLMAAATYVFAPWLAARVLSAPHLSGALRVGSLIMFLNALNGAQTGALAGFEAFRTIACVNLLSGVASFPMLVCGTYVGGLHGAVWALAVNLGLNWLLNHVALRREARRYGIALSYKRCVRERDVLWRFSLPAFLNGTVDRPIYWVCAAMLVNQPDGYSQMGVYSVGLQWEGLLLFLPSVLGSVIIPVLSERLGQNDTRRSARTLVFAIKSNLLLVLPLALVASILSPYIMGLYGEGFRNGWPTLILLLLSAAVLAPQQSVWSLIAASENMWLGFAMNVAWAFAIVAGTMLLRTHGSVGVATARLASHMLHATWTSAFAVWFVRRQRASRLNKLTEVTSELT